MSKYALSKQGLTEAGFRLEKALTNKWYAEAQDQEKNKSEFMFMLLNQELANERDNEIWMREKGISLPEHLQTDNYNNYQQMIHT